MKLPDTHEHKSRLRLPLILVVAVAAVGVMLLPVARSNSAAAISITVTNNSQRQIRHLYLAPGDPDNWGPDQLNNATIQPGASFVLSNVTCSGSTIRVIAEDQDGCFFYRTVSCGENATWTIAADAPRDCG